jgi:TPR repeat protein
MIQNALKFLRGALVFIPSVMLLAVLGHSEAAFAATENVHKLQVKAERGFVKEEVELASAYFTGDGVVQDARLAAYRYQKAAESGNPEAQNQVGYFYEAGLGVPADPARALHWYQLSAASGSPDATLNLGVLYVLGLGVEKNVPVAEQYFQEAARKGNGTGATYMGTLNYFGIGVQQDKAAAEHWYTIGQKLHDPMSAYNLGTLYSTVPDHPHDLSKAAGYLRQFVEGGYVPAMHSLAVLLIHHPELARSPDEAVHLLEFAANVGYWRSSLVLGVLVRGHFLRGVLGNAAKRREVESPVGGDCRWLASHSSAGVGE